MRIIDLSLEINEQTKIYPGDSAPEIISVRENDEDYMITSIKLGSHTATHVDAPLHAIAGASGLGDFKLDAYIGEAVIIDFHDAEDQSIFDINKIRASIDRFSEIDKVILRTDWHRRCRDNPELDLFADYPALDMKIADLLVERGIKLIGVESPSISPDSHYEIHQRLLKADIVIVENLVNVSEISRSIAEIHAVPLNIPGIDGSPVRAYAIEHS